MLTSFIEENRLYMSQSSTSRQSSRRKPLHLHSELPLSLTYLQRGVAFYWTTSQTTVQKQYEIFLVLAVQCKCRKYDIEEEAHKLYGDSFSNVVQKFRKTPEYLKILQSQVSFLILFSSFTICLAYKRVDKETLLSE